MFRIKFSVSIGSVAGAALTIVLASQAHAQTQEAVSANTSGQFVQDIGGSERINLSGKLRMLSQRIPAAACNLNAGIAPDESAAVLNAAFAEFEQVLTGLEVGDEALGIIGPEERPRTLRVIQEVHSKLEPFETAMLDQVENVPTDAAVGMLADSNTELLEIVKLLVSEIAAQYSNPAALLQSDAMAIDIAGRQRLLTQKASKEICLILSDINAAASRETLGMTIGMFETSLGALQNGMTDAGLNPPPNDDIVQGLAAVHADWFAVKDQLDAVLAGQALSDADRATVFTALNKTMADMNAVVGMYSEASKLGL